MASQQSLIYGYNQIKQDLYNMKFDSVLTSITGTLSQKYSRNDQVNQDLNNVKHDSILTSFSGNSSQKRIGKFSTIEWFKESRLSQLQLDYIKFYTIEQIEMKFSQELQLMSRISECNYWEPISELSYNVFSWEEKDFLERRAYTDQTFIKVLKKIPDSCLELYKFRMDIKQLLNYISLIFDGIYSELGHLVLNIVEYIERPLRNTRSLILRTAFLEDEYKKRMSEYTSLFNNHLYTSFGDDVLEQKQVKAKLQAKLLYKSILDPIQLRYTINWYKLKLEEKTEKMKMIENNLQNDIQTLTIKTNWETEISNNCKMFLFEYIDQLKNEIAQMQTKYELELDNIDLILTTKHLQINKLREQIRFTKDELILFQEEIDQARKQEKTEADKIQTKQRRTTKSMQAK